MDLNNDKEISFREEVLCDFLRILENKLMKSPKNATPAELNMALGEAIMESYGGRRRLAAHPEKGKKRAYYLSAEFLVGRAVYNNILSLGLEKEVKECFKRCDIDYSCLEETGDAGLGNGGLGRLAACFVDSGASLALPLIGYGIKYEYGIFKQKIDEDGQKEIPNDWTKFGDPWSIPRGDKIRQIGFDDMIVEAYPYDMPIFGYDNNFASYIRLWQARPATPFDFEKFNAQDYEKALTDKNEAENISRVLYPADDTERGKTLRLRQQYFFTSATLLDVIEEYKSIHGSDFSSFCDENVFQLNDTHPVIAIPEFLRLMCECEGMDFESAYNMAKKVFAYTNHTVMSEALEVWDEKLFKKILSGVYKYIELIYRKQEEEFESLDLTKEEKESMKIIADDKIHMARLAVFIAKNVNGVAKIHTDILKTEVFETYNRIYPGKIVNITNGITQRRWLMLANPELAGFTTKLLGDDKWTKDLSRINGLLKRSEDKAVCAEFNNIKKYRRKILSDYISAREGIKLDPNSVFDIQIKRIHEYKRQLLNAMSALLMYFEIKEGTIKPKVPVTIIFGGKAAPGYKIAKSVIRFICKLEKLISEDSEVSNYLRVHFIENYNVSYAEKLVGAADISEQISTAGTEASGTGNMKMMLNGALTLGTLDGANVEIVSEAGRENNYIFGAVVDEIEKIRKGYKPYEIYEKNERIKRVLDFMREMGFEDLYDSLLLNDNADRYFLLYDFDDYYNTKLKAINDFANREVTAKMGICNMAGAGKFSSDRSVKNYSEKIWGLSPVKPR